MSFVKCFDVVSMVIEEGCNQFKPLWKLNEEKYGILKQYCEEIDKLSQEFEGESFEVDVDDITMSVSITLDCYEITIPTKSHRFYDLAQRANAVSFSKSEDGDGVSVKFTFPSVWDKA